MFAKLEYLNPGGSVKDRAAIGIIRRAEQEGKLVPGGTIVEATAGNTGIGLALIGVNRGYKVKLFVPENFSQEKVIIMRALGAEVDAYSRRRGHAGRDPARQRTWSPVIPCVHGRTIRESRQSRLSLRNHRARNLRTDGRPNRRRGPRLRHLRNVYRCRALCEGKVAAACTRSRSKPRDRCWAADEPGPHKVEGIGASFIPKTFDRSVCDEVMMVTDDDAFDMVKAAGSEGRRAGGIERRRGGVCGAQRREATGSRASAW